MPTTTKTKKATVAPEVREQILPILKRAAVLQAMRWDAEREIEILIDRELNHSESSIKDLAEFMDANYDDSFVTLKDVDKYLQDEDFDE